MDSVWLTTDFSNEIIDNKNVNDYINSIVTDLLSNRVSVVTLVENLGGALTSSDPEHRERGMSFFSKLLSHLPETYLNDVQLNFISKFYVDRLKDHHRVIPAVLEGYLKLIDMQNYDARLSGEFFIVLFREVPCQSQVRVDRYHIYLIIEKLLKKNGEYMKSLGPDLLCGFISAMDGERDPRNLLFLFTFLPKLLTQIPLGHLTEEMFDVISCYYPIDFHPSPDDPTAVTRDELAIALAPCLCAIPEFAEPCLTMLIEKLGSSLLVAKIDSLRLLTESCKVFPPEAYNPYLKVLWQLIRTDISHKSDESLKMAAHIALSTLVKKLATTASTDRAFESFIEGILLAMQTDIADASTVTRFVQATKVLLTSANASRESCVIITGSMIPAAMAFYEYKKTPKLQVCSLDFILDLYDLAKAWKVLDVIAKQVKDIPQICLTAVSEQAKDYQIAGLRTLNKTIDLLEPDLVLPYVEVLTHNVQHTNDIDLLTISIETVHNIARKYPELIMQLIVKGKCDLDNLTTDKTALKERLHLLCSLISIDEFTKVIIEEMLALVVNGDPEAPKVLEALSRSISETSMYSDEKIIQIESDHNLINSVISWLLAEIEITPPEVIEHAFALISNTISSLPAEKAQIILERYTTLLLEKCQSNKVYFYILESLYNSIHQSIFNEKFKEIMDLSLELSLTSENVVIRKKACALTAHFLNKAEHGPNFELLYEFLKNYLSSMSSLSSSSGTDPSICPRLIHLYGWITKALVMRSSVAFLFWLQKIVTILSNPDHCESGSEAIQLIITNHREYFTPKQHCRVSPVYKQRVFLAFFDLAENLDVCPASKEYFLLSWAYVIGNSPKRVVDKIAPLVIESLAYDNKELLQVMLDVLRRFAQEENPAIAESLQTILPRLIPLTKYANSMDVRIEALECLYEIANTLRTAQLLPYKLDVLSDLAPSLDDKKRLVRNAAVRARSRWFLIGAPGEDKTN